MTVHKIPWRGDEYVYLCGKNRKAEAKLKNYGQWLWRLVTCPACKKKGKK